MKKRIILILLFLFLAIFLLFPLVILVSNSISLQSFSPNFIEKLKEAFKNSFSIAMIVSIISVVISYVISFLIVNYHFQKKNLILMFLTLPMLVPTFTHALGFISFWGRNGFFNNLFNTHINIYGFWGIVLCSVCYVLPLSLIMFVDLLASENRTPYKVADTLGIPKFSQFLKIKISYLFKPTLFILFTVFTMSITDYGIPMMIGGRTVTLTTMIYEQIVGRLNFANGAFIGILLLAPAIILFVVSLFMKSHDNFEYRLEEVNTRNSLPKILSVLVYILVFIFVAFPLISCVFISFVKKFPIDLSLSFTHVVRVIQNGSLKYLMNSLCVSFFASIFGIFISFCISYIATRVAHKKTSKLLHLLAIFTSTVPGIVLAVSYMFAFHKTIIYGTILILIIINVIRYMGNPYLMLFNKLDNLDKTIEVTASTLGIPRKNIIMDVIIPQIFPSIIEGFCYIFVNTMASVTTMLFLATAFTKPLALIIVELEAHNFIEMAAFVSLIIFITNVIIKSFVFFFSKRYTVNRN